jgi:hypothetical protein
MSTNQEITDYTNQRVNDYNNQSKKNSFGSDYSVGSYSYPTGLGVNPDLQHYVEFFRNVRGKSKFIKNYETLKNPIVNSRRDNPGLNSGDGLKKSLALTTGGSVVSGIVAGTDAFLKRGGYAGSTAAVRAAAQTGVAGAAAVAVVGATLATSIMQNDKKFRLKDVITLAMQEKPSVTYGINYQDKDMGILGGFLTGDTSLSDTPKAELGAAFGLQLAKIPSLLPGFGTASLSDIVQLGAKVKTNPFREVFFEGIDYRKFNFRYKFMPRNVTEVKAVYSIIDKFKEHMHPELSAGGYFYIYPSEFEIRYYYNNQENGYFNKITSCALTDMSIEYGGDQFSSFSNGAPSEINVILSFRELDLQTRENIREQGV